MGLTDRLKPYLLELAGRDAAQVEAALKAAQAAESARLQALSDEKQRLAEENAARATKIDEFSTLLKVVGAREQLEEVKKIWTVGEIDSNPRIFYHYGSSDYKETKSKPDNLPLSYLSLDKIKMGLALSYKFLDVTESGDSARGDPDGPGPWIRSGSRLYEHEVRFLIITSLPALHSESDLPSVTTLYQEPHLGGTTYYIDKNEPPYTSDQQSEPSGWHPQGPETIFPDDQLRSRGILEEQLFAMRDHMRPLVLEQRARERIIGDPYIPQKVKYQHFPELRTPLPWYRRILG